ncbi:AMP-binding protein [Rhizobium sp.]|uniref:AMP-binding protein n=1 Tax=Rhizobium sp. TaxID=391 RepID=UPI0028A7E400
MLSGLSHDPIMRDVFVPLLTGGELHIPRQEILLKPDQLAFWLAESRIEYAHLTPQMVGLLSAVRGTNVALNDLRYVFCGGDVLLPSHAECLRAIAPNATLVNFYGTSETPQAMAYQIIGTGLDAPYPLGLPIDDVQIHITDETQQILPPGEQGEIVVETRFLSLGYAGAAIAPSDVLAGPPTAATFLASLTSDDPEVRAYRTGDMGFKDDEGRIHFCGRRDDQVKIRGYRVNCREIAETLERHGLAGNALVLPEKDEDGQTSLVAYLVDAPSTTRNRMAEWLPSYMVPAEIVHVDEMPLLPNGKIDRAALRRKRQSGTSDVSRDQQSPLTVALLEILRRPGADPKQTFVDLGGDSLSFITASLMIEDHLGFLPENWENMPIERIIDLRRQMPSGSRSLSRWFGAHRIELSVALRAISIITIVLSHAGAVYSSGSPVLFVISGISFARFRLSGIIANLTIGPVVNLVLKYGIPAGLWQIFRSFYLNEKLWIPDVLLMGTMWQRVPVGHFTFWFLDILTACILILTGLGLAFGYARRRLHAPLPLGDMMMPFSLAALAIALALFGVQAYTGWWDGELGATSTGPFRWLWVFVFGACIHAASVRLQKWAAVGAFAVTMAIVGLVGGDYTTWSFFFVASVLALIFVKSVPIPRIAAKVVAIIASNSLYIYIVNASVISHVLPKLGIEHSPVAGLSMSLAVGIGVGIFWEKLMAITGKAVRLVRHGRRSSQQNDRVATLPQT